uniref:Chitin-binding type-2 domain-containing protein n=1 Tax=Anopheles merus TaxID=30066 RepID=A0A182V4I2_ANOME
MSGWPILILLALASLTFSANAQESCLRCGFPTGNKLHAHAHCAQTGPRKYFRDQHDCAKFYQCNRGTAYEFLCAEGYAFNEEQNACEHIAKVRCPTVSADPSNTHQLEYDFVRASGAGQRNRTSGHEESSHHSSSHQLEYDFVRASGAGQRNRTSGHEGSSHHSSSHQLEHDFVRASGAGQRNRTSVHQESSHHSSSHQLEHDFARASGAGQRNRTSSHEGSASHQLEYDFVRASGAGQRNHTTCNICQQAKQVIQRHGNCPHTNGYYPVMFRNENDCSQFYQCDHGTAYLIQCPAGLHFNTRLSVCDYPDKVDCNGPVLNEHVTGGAHGGHGGSPSCAVCQSATSVVHRHPQCPTRNGPHPIMFRHRTDCTKYYQCDHGTAFEITCPAGLHFNTALNVCDYPERVGCSEGAVGSGGASEAPAVDRPVVAKIHPNCPAVTGRQEPAYWAHPHECGKYFGCQWGCVELLSCPAGHRWDDGKKACSPDESLECANAEW